MLFPLLIATGLAGHGYRKKSLSPSGAAAAFVVGATMLSGPLKVWGIALIVFYLVGSRATKYGKTTKKMLESNYHEAGYRSAWQVISNSFSALIATLLWRYYYASSYSTLACPLDQLENNGIPRSLILAALGHFACCLGDTLASELGILSLEPPILITTFKTVPKGTNGGVSFLGTVASVSGGLIMGITMAGTLVLENRSCRAVADAMGLILYGGFAGAFGSLIDSLLGATLQSSVYDEEKKMIINDGDDGEKHEKERVVSGWDILSNNQVNVVASVLTSLVMTLM